ncbi:eCIS core domain-containing protein [Streptomyces sp. NPDC002817]|uniref:eCIS core domain-containing protein n=1 Tax=Streptomyces sp. NPDC088357 TaxID=3154655 RepID=UPI0034305B76
MIGRLKRTPDTAVARAPSPGPDRREKAADRTPDTAEVLREASVAPVSPADRHESARPADGRGLLAQELTRVVARMADGGTQEPSEREAERIADQVARGHRVDPPRESPETGPDAERHPTSLTEVLSDPEPGRPLPPATREVLESRMGADLGDVRIHTEHRADTAAADLDAHAFTYGTDVYLAAGSSAHDIRLMAHEATHVLQQRGGEPRVHRAEKGSSAPPTGPDKPKKATEPTAYEKDDQSVVTGTDTVEIMPLTLPAWKITWPGEPARKLGADSLNVRKHPDVPVDATGKRNTKQTGNWDNEVKGRAEGAVRKKFEGKKPLSIDSTEIYALKYRNGQGYVIGTLEDVAQRVGRPGWDRHGTPRVFNVDHFQEIQLGGLDKPSNYILLEAGPNQTAGALINTQINRRIQLAYSKASPPRPDIDPQKIRAQEKSTVKEIRAGQLGGLPPQSPHWRLEEIGDLHRGPIAALTFPEANDPVVAELFGLPGAAKDRLWIVTSKTVGSAISVPWESSGKPKKIGAVHTFPWFALTNLEYDPEKKEGQLDANVGPQGKEGKTEGPAILPQEIADLKLKPVPGLPGAVQLREGDLEAKMRSLKLWGFSPIDVTSVELDDTIGLRLRGVLRPTIPLFQGTAVDFRMEGKHIAFEKTFDIASLTLPPPLRVTQSSFTVSLGTDGLGVDGVLLFSVDHLGSGRLGAGASLAEGFDLAGSFDFDSDLFEPARFGVHYRRKSEDDFSFGGTAELGIPANKVRGIRRASVKAALENDAFTASGTAELDIPGVKSGSFEVRQDPKEGFAATGTFQLADNIPGIRSGELSASVVKSPEDNRWKISARGTAVPAIPGVDAQITAQYDDGAFTLEGSAAYAKGMLSGSLLIGVTNRPVTPEGQPAGPPGKDLTAYGGGSVTARLAPWLQGTVGIRILRKGEVELAGSIALPDTLKLFEARTLERNILRIGLDIPIVGVAVLGHRVGIFATISGALDADAGVGPGELRQLALAITYNPAHEDQTKVTGDARLFIPAHAGLRLSVRGALGAGISLVSAEAGLEIGGRLGVEGAVEAGLHVDWTPAKGLVLNAEVKVSAEPVFTFDIAGYVLVEADLPFRTVELYSKRWELAKVSYGSGLRIGLTFPLHYEEGKPFEPSLADARLELPEIDPRQIIGDLVRRIA